jgi:hypothetical protein
MNFGPNGFGYEIPRREKLMERTMTLIQLAEYEESRAHELARFAETAGKYLGNPEEAESYDREAQSHYGFAAALLFTR